MKDFVTFIKAYSTRDFIYLFSGISAMIFRKQISEEKENLNCCMTFPVNAILHGFIHKQVPVMLPAWDIHGMAYLSAVNSNDYRKNIMKVEQAGTVVNLYRGYENDHSGSKYLKDANLQGIFKFVMGMTYEQFKFQNISWTYQNFNRNYHILLGSQNIHREKIIDINEITNDLFGLNVDEFLSVEMLILILCSQQPDPLSVVEKLYQTKGQGIFSKANLQKIIDYYSVSYDDIRKSTLKKQIFYSKPFIITQKKQERIAVSFYLVQMLLADGLYWLIRDYYQKKRWGTRFINAFGEMFEDYFEEIADMYLPKGAWHKIPVQKNKSADFFVEVEDAVFLFELKSGLLGIGAKQQTPDVQQIDTFYNRNILEAYEQLKMSEQKYKGLKPIIKVFLLYENTTNTQIIMTSIPEIFVKDKNCYIMTIEDLEMMLVTYENNREKFRKVVKTLVQNENSESHCESVLKILNDNDAIDAIHFIDNRDYFGKIMEKLEMELK